MGARKEAGTVPTVVIVGAGCAGTLVAVNLLRGRGSLRVVLVERSGSFGPGVAYATADERHRLNVVAERMSAFPDAPGHFADWARRTLGPQPPGAYLPRARFGDYLRELLDGAARDAAPARRLERVTGEVVDVVPDPAAATVVLGDGRRIEADRVVLALGSLPAAAPVALPDDPRVVADPWAAGALGDVDRDQTTLLIGSGLTAVDATLSLCGASARSRVVAVSRNGCLPYDQLPGLRAAVPAPPLPPAPATVERLERWIARHVWRMRREGCDWRDAIDGLRPQLDRLWQSLPLAERERFLRERSRAWELRRHRMAPAVAGRVRELIGEGRLLVRAGTVVAVRALPRTVEVLVSSCQEEARRGGDGTASGDLRTLRADRVVVCAGPGTDVRRARVPLLQSLLRSGVAAADPLGLGLRATPGGSLLAADGRAQPRVHLLGPLRRGPLWETTAVPEISVQAAAVARAVAAA